MEALRFTISGETAFFKMPEVNSFYYFTYSCIHKVSLLGILGATLGLGGYSQQGNKEFPEFYEKLKDLKLSIIPRNEHGYVAKKIQTFNNSVGYASQEQGGNLIVKQQWLEHPKWTIYLLLDQEIANQIAEAILSRKCVYNPYLGSNDHPAVIEDREIIKLVEATSFDHINSLFLKHQVEYAEVDDEDEETESIYRYQEKLPIALNNKTNLYEIADCVFTNAEIRNYNDTVYKADHRCIVFL